MNTQPANSAVPARRTPGRVLVTGATGLLGSNVTAELLAAGAEVLARARSAERARSLLPAHERLRRLPAACGGQPTAPPAPPAPAPPGTRRRGAL